LARESSFATLFLPFFLLATASLTGEDGWTIQETGVFRPLNHSEVIIGAGGQVYIAELGKPQISLFDATGHFQKKFGGLGSGPGEFQGIIAVRYDLSSQLLYVMDVRLTHFHVFDKDGGFLRTLKLPRKPMLPLKLVDGWATSTNDPSQPGLVITDDDFQNGSTVLKWGKPNETQSVDTSGGRVKITRQLGTERAIHVINRKGDKIFVPQHDEAAVYIVDVLSRQIACKIDIGLKPLPIAPSWVSEAIEREQREIGKLPVLLNYSVAENFPLIKEILPGPGHLLRIFHSVHYVHNDIPPLIFDEQGREVATHLNAFALKHMVAAIGDWAYLAVFDKHAEEAKIIKVNLDEANGLAAEFSD